MKPIPVIALLLSVAALAIAIIEKDSPELPESSLRTQIFKLRSRSFVNGLPPWKHWVDPQSWRSQARLLEKRIEELSSQQQDIAELALSIDSLGVIETHRAPELVNAYNILVDDQRPAWERAKQAAFTQAYGQFSQGAVDSMWKLFSDPQKPYDPGSRLACFEGACYPGTSR